MGNLDILVPHYLPFKDSVTTTLAIESFIKQEAGHGKSTAQLLSEYLKGEDIPAAQGSGMIRRTQLRTKSGERRTTKTAVSGSHDIESL